MNPSLHPEVLRLTKENTLLREELAQLLTEAHDLIQIVKPNLLAIYQTKIGVWELKLLRMRCKAARLKRTLELAQVAINRGMSPDWIAIEGTVELEFLEWQAKIREALTEFENAEHRLKHLLSPQDSRKLTKLYHALVKQLHPDLNPQLTEDQRRLWLRVQTAYDSSNIEELEALTIVAEKQGAVEPLPSSLENLRHEQESLHGHIAATLARMEKIQSQPPFTMQKKLESKEWIATRKADIESQTAEQEKLAGIFLEQLEALRNRHGYGQQPGRN